MKSYLLACKPAMMVAQVVGTNSSFRLFAAANLRANSAEKDDQLPLFSRTMNGGPTAAPMRTVLIAVGVAPAVPPLLEELPHALSRLAQSTPTRLRPTSAPTKGCFFSDCFFSDVIYLTSY